MTLPLLVCQSCFGAFAPPSVPDECPGCGATDDDVEDAPLWSRRRVLEEQEQGERETKYV